MQYRILCADMAMALSAHPEHITLVRRWEELLSVAIDGDNKYNRLSQ